MMLANQPSRLKYIGAWICAGFLSRILGTIADTLLVDSIVQDVNDLNTYFIVGSILNAGIVVGSVILIYNYFYTLNMKIVMPYFYTLGTFGTIMGMVSTSAGMTGLDVQLGVYYTTTLISFFASVIIVRNYYKKKYERWN